MFNLVKAELYKTRRRAYPKIFLCVFAGILVLFAVLMNVTWNPESTCMLFPSTGEIMLIFTVCLVSGMYLAPVTADMVFSEEYKHGTMKNTVAFGYTRSQLYFSKLIAASIVTVVMALLVAAGCIAVSWAFFRTDSAVDKANTIYFIKYTFRVLPLWLTQVAICIAVWFNIKNATFGTVLVVVYTALLPSILNMIYLSTEKAIFVKIADKLPISHFKLITDASNGALMIGDMWECLIDGVCFFALFTVIGWIGFRKKEIK